MKYKEKWIWFSYNDEKLGQGRENVKQYLRDNPNLLKELDLKIRDALKSKTKV